VEVSSLEVVGGDDAPVVQVVDRILTQAMRDRSSDVHIEPSEDVVRVRFRIDGALTEILVLPAAMGLGLVSRIKIMAGMNIVERRRPQDGQLTTTVDGKEVDVRVATTATIWGERCVMRILDKTRSVLRLDDLGMPSDTHAKYSKIVRAPFGMVLCAGPTGSGKTTTLYATLSEVNNPTLNVMTIEDPVEYVFPSINQIQTNDQAGLSFATGLKSILRQDPDVILVGEIRDVETARVAVQSALTGHFVISSLHATDAVSALHRFLDMGIESFLIASSVLAVVGQRLVRRICPSCKTRYTPTAEELAFYEDSGGPAKEAFFRGTGCNFCSDTGYQDRIGVYELLEMTPEIRRLIVGWATQEELRSLAQKQGMRTLRTEATILVAQDITTVAEVMRSMYTL
jgi:type IV pilus assembly protein PilB